LILDGIWKEFLNIIRQEAGSRVVETWLKAVVLYEWDDANKVAYIQAPNKFVRDWIFNNYIELFKIHLKRLFNVESISVRILDSYPDSKNVIPSIVDRSESRFIRDKSKLPAKRFSHINELYTFDNFIVGSNNSLAYAATKAISEKPGSLYNPLFIYGGSGLGKTHLLNAIGNEIRNKFKNLNVLYQPADRFVNEFITAIRFDKIHVFQEKYKIVDILLVDDIQFMANKDQTQETFFHIFNFLYEAGKQIVFSSDIYPADLQGMAKRLKSRFESGLVADIKKPSIETKIAILKRKADLHDEQLPDDVSYFIASKISSSIRELEGALIRVIAFAHLTSQAISLELAKKVLFKIKRSSEDNIDFQSISNIVCKKYSFSLKELRSSKKFKEVALARQTAMYLMKHLTDKSLRDICVFFDRKDHTTVVHAIKKIESLCEKDDDFKLMLNQMEEEILN
jgi:chromosomal replication initiator protein